MCVLDYFTVQENFGFVICLSVIFSDPVVDFFRWDFPLLVSNTCLAFQSLNFYVQALSKFSVYSPYVHIPENISRAGVVYTTEVRFHSVSGYDFMKTRIL